MGERRSILVETLDIISIRESRSIFLSKQEENSQEEESSELQVEYKSVVHQKEESSEQLQAEGSSVIHQEQESSELQQAE